MHRKIPMPESLFLAFNLIEKETLTHVFSYEFCKISKNSFLHNCFWSSNDSLYFYGDLDRRFYILLSSEKKNKNNKQTNKK